MPKHWLLASASVLALALALLLRHHLSAPAPRHVSRGRNNTVLFLADAASGLSNVHLATARSLCDRLSPPAEVHYASFPRRRDAVAPPITWHELRGPDVLSALGPDEALIMPPGVAGIGRMLALARSVAAAFGGRGYDELYGSASGLIEAVDPAVVVVEPMLGPCVDAVRDARRLHAVVSPNALSDFLILQQPLGAVFWKYPPTGSGLPFPIPWRSVPYSVYYQARVMTSYFLGQLRSRAAGAGSRQRTGILTAYRPDVPWLAGVAVEGGLPLRMPANVTACGPIVLDTTGMEADAELSRWLGGAPTVFVNLGSIFRYDEARAAAMARAVGTLLAGTDLQVLWKFDKRGDYGDAFMDPLRGHVRSRRLRLESWLELDPFAILDSGHVAAFVHHGGANSFNEAMLAGVPQVILPLWYDLYSYARLVEYLGVGVWPGKQTAPEWEAAEIVVGVEEVLGLESGASIRRKAAELGATARAYGGKECAADAVAALARTGK